MSRTLDVVHLVLTTEKMSVTRRQACQSRGRQDHARSFDFHTSRSLKKKAGCEEIKKEIRVHTFDTFVVVVDDEVSSSVQLCSIYSTAQYIHNIL